MLPTEKITLPNGLRVLLEPQPNVRTACFGVWVKSGSAYEYAGNNGISHLIEHMLFKGTHTRSAMDIAEEIDSIGGQMNAYTAKDYTCFYARALQEHVGQAFSVLADMVTAPRLDEQDVQTEKSVVFEEISMSEDMPEDRVVENQYSAVWKGSSLGLPILGSIENLQAMDRFALCRWMKERYIPSHMVIAVCGRFDRESFLASVYKYFAEIPSACATIDNVGISYRKALQIEEQEQEQTHICMCVPGLDSFDPRKHALNMLNIIAGGSTSSRLFQKIREELGLAYSVDTNTLSYPSGGLFEMQTAVNPDSAEKACEEIIKVIEQLRGGVTQREFRRAKEQLKSGILMGMESISARAGHMGRSELLKGRIESEDEIIAQVQGVRIEDIDQIAAELLDKSRLSVSVVGPKPNEAFYKGLVHM